MKRKRKKQSTQKSYTCKIFGLIVAITVIAVSGGILLKRTITESPENTLMEYMNHIEILSGQQPHREWRFALRQARCGGV